MNTQYSHILVKSKRLFFLALFAFSFSAIGQSKKDAKAPENPYLDEARDLVIEGTDALANQEGGVIDFEAFAEAESKLRTAISLTPESVPAKYNAGNNYYQNKKWEESTAVLIKASEVAKTKNEKHQAFHNLGNAFYQQKNWDGAVEAYKNALRADPTDEETRYNLQMAKKEKEKNGGGGGGGDDDNKDEDNQDDNNENKEQNEKDNEGEGDKKESDDGEEGEQDDKGKDKKDEGEQKEDDKGKPKDQDKKNKGGEGDKQQQPPPQPQQGKLSPQRVQSLLKAMQDQEQKTQEKINAQKVKGAKVKTEKDW